ASQAGCSRSHATACATSSENRSRCSFSTTRHRPNRTRKNASWRMNAPRNSTHMSVCWLRSSDTCSHCAMEPGSRSTRSERSSMPPPEPCASACIGLSNSYDGGIPMTTDQLERALTLLAEPHAEDERLHAAIRVTLEEQLHARRSKYRRPAFAL